MYKEDDRRNKTHVIEMEGNIHVCISSITIRVFMQLISIIILFGQVQSISCCFLYKNVQWNPYIADTIGELHVGRYRGVL